MLGGMFCAINNKMDKKTIDETPTSGSSNLVTSGGVFSAIDKKQDKLTAGDGIKISGTTISAESSGGSNYIALTRSTVHMTYYEQPGISSTESTIYKATLSDPTSVSTTTLTNGKGYSYASTFSSSKSSSSSGMNYRLTYIEGALLESISNSICINGMFTGTVTADVYVISAISEVKAEYTIYMENSNSPFPVQLTYTNSILTNAESTTGNTWRFPITTADHSKHAVRVEAKLANVKFTGSFA